MYSNKINVNKLKEIKKTALEGQIIAIFTSCICVRVPSSGVRASANVFGLSNVCTQTHSIWRV